MSADGRLLVAANPTTGTVTLWSVPDRRLLFTEPGRPTTPRSHRTGAASR